MTLKQLHEQLVSATSLVEGAIQAEARAAEATKQAEAAEARMAKAETETKRMEAVATRKINDALTQAEHTKATAQKHMERDVATAREKHDALVKEMKEESARTLATLTAEKARLADLQRKTAEAEALLAKLQEAITENKKRFAQLVA